MSRYVTLKVQYPQRRPLADVLVKGIATLEGRARDPQAHFSALDQEDLTALRELYTQFVEKE